jgi:hypothetical protein
MKNKIFLTVITILAISLIIFCYVRFEYIYAKGTKAGVLNTFQKKGYVFKTWEGIIIQSGFKANIQSNEFVFSVTDESVAAILEKNSGREINLHYIRYFGILPWRGMSNYIVDSVYEVRGVAPETVVRPK